MSEQGGKMVHLQRHNYDRYAGFQRGSFHPVPSLNENDSLKTKELEKGRFFHSLREVTPEIIYFHVQFLCTVNIRWSILFKDMSDT